MNNPCEFKFQFTTAESFKFQSEECRILETV